MAQNTFRSKVVSKYLSAVKSNSVIFSDTTTYRTKENGINYQLRFAPQFLKKPYNPAKPSSSPAKPRFDPFEKPEENLYVTPLGKDHYIVLNKWPIIPAHFLLVTNAFENQEDKLAKRDLEAVSEVFKLWYDDDKNNNSGEGGSGGGSEKEQGKNHISETAIADADVHKRSELFGFFNCGDDSGASQPHRHLQFLTLGSEEAASLFITEYVDTPNPAPGVVTSHPSARFEHYIYPFPPPTSSSSSSSRIVAGDVLVSAYDALLASISTPCYNLAFTTRWMAICPRTRETAYPVAQGSGSGVIMDGSEVTVPGLNLNGTILAGMMLVKTDVELRALLEEAGTGICGRTLAQVGLPRKDGSEGGGEVKGMI